jgi:hypothetical protein
MSSADLSGIQLAAALAEEVYRRNPNDLPITLANLTGTSAVPLDPPPGLSVAAGADGSIYYYSSRGFVGQVVLKDNTLYVVFRGTDASSSFLDGFSKAAASGFDQTAIDASHLSDLGDFTSDLLLGQGTARQTQLDDALALTRAAEAEANARGKQVVVVGQSLGGGLAALVSAMANVPGYAIDPAPFQNQLSAAADRSAFAQSDFNVPLIPDGLSPDFFANSPDNQRKILEANGYADSVIDNFFALASATFALPKANSQGHFANLAIARISFAASG